MQALPRRLLLRPHPPRRDSLGSGLPANQANTT